MGKKLHIGNLSYSVTEDMLNGVFTKLGTVVSVSVIKDKMSGRSKGFGFVEMSTDEEAADAIEKLNKFELEGRTIFVSESRPKEASSGGFAGPKRRFNDGGHGGGGGNRDRERRPRY